MPHCARQRAFSSAAADVNFLQVSAILNPSGPMSPFARRWPQPASRRLSPQSRGYPAGSVINVPQQFGRLGCRHAGYVPGAPRNRGLDLPVFGNVCPAQSLSAAIAAIDDTLGGCCFSFSAPRGVLAESTPGP
jgi:hypothetical protein